MKQHDIGETPCQSMPPAVFDKVDIIDSREGLEACRGCSAKLACLLAVDPFRSYYDGIAGGYVWVDGRVKEWSAVEIDTIGDYYATLPANRTIPVIEAPAQDALPF